MTQLMAGFGVFPHALSTVLLLAVKVTLVQPPSLMAVDNYSTITLPPLGIGYLAAFARQHGHEVHVVDAVGQAVTRLRPWPRRARRLFQGLSFEEIIPHIPRDSDVIGVSCMFTHSWPMVRDLLIELKRAFPRARLIAGGEHVTSLYEQVFEQAPVDVCVLGEGEHSLIEVLSVFEKGGDLSGVSGIAYRASDGRPVKTGKRERIADPDTLPWPAWDLMDPMAYLEAATFLGPKVGRSIPMLASRGCPYRCTFCASPQMWTTLWKPRNPAKVVDEMENWMKVYGANDFQFQDLTAIVEKDWIIAFCKELISRKLAITWTLPVGTRSEAIDSEVAKLLMASGCHHITYVPESGSERILKAIKKRVHLQHLEQSAVDSLQAGMKVCMFMLIGLPQETKEDIKKTFQLIRRMARLGVHEIAVSSFIPLPGTQLFHETARIKPITLDDEYFYRMAGSTTLFSVKSWNPRFSDRQLQWMKLYALGQFYLLSYLYHPGRAGRVVFNLFRQKQETKVDRVVHEFVAKFRALIASKVRGSEEKVARPSRPTERQGREEKGRPIRANERSELSEGLGGDPAAERTGGNSPKASEASFVL
jgi:radical SAM superfamily enzyme YgiQ (UPF0313 family)